MGDIVKEINRIEPLSNAPIMMISAKNGFINQSDRYSYDNTGKSLKKYILLKKGELAYNHGASKIRPFGSCFVLKDSAARVPFVYHCFTVDGCDPMFLELELNSKRIAKQLRKLISSSARMDGLLNISYMEYTTVSIMMPKLNEQIVISSFFQKLDNIITLHQCE